MIQTKQPKRGFFDPPEGVTGEDAKYYAPRLAMTIAGAGVHVMQGALFVYYNVPNMILFNIFAFIVWTIGGVLVRRNYPLLGVNLSFWEGYLHINTVVYLYGITTGYHYFFTVGVIAPFLLFGTQSRRHIYLPVLCTLLAGLFAPFFAPQALPATLPSNAVAAFSILNIINLPGSLVFLAGLAYYFRISTQRAEDAAEYARQQEAAANRAKSIFLANMSHEIRTPMNAILGYAQLLNSDATLATEHKKAVETIDQSGEHLLELINDVLDISKIEAGREQLNPTDFDLHSLLNGLSAMFDIRCQQKNLTWHLETHIPPGTVHGDEGKLRQVLINLLGNAVKFTEEGAVTLKVTTIPDPQPHFLFEVIDTGPGIPTEKQTAIFEPFQQDQAGVQHGGTGLGLAISQRHIELMGSTITLDSPCIPFPKTNKSDTPQRFSGEGAGGRGARFSFTLTLPPGKSLPVEPQTDWSRVQHIVSAQTIHALVVDDIANNRDVLSQMLTNIGIKVQTAENGQQALDIVQNHMPDVIFMDIRMPVLNGSETLKKLIEQHGQNATRVIAATASVFEHQRQEYLDLGFDDFINKPLRTGEVYASLAKQLGIQFSFAESIETTTQPDNWMTCTLPPDLLSNLQTAAAEHSITELRKHIQTLKNLGTNEQKLADHLNDLASQFDLESVKHVLQKITP